MAGLGWLDYDVGRGLQKETGAPWYSFIPGASFFGMDPAQYYMAHHPRGGASPMDAGTGHFLDVLTGAFKAAMQGLAVKLDGHEVGVVVAEEMGQTEHRHGREGQTGKRPRNEIAYHAVRTGDNVGEHEIIFGLMGETLEVYVRGHTRDSYAYGALAAAKFIAGKGAGLYSMADVLGL